MSVKNFFVKKRNGQLEELNVDKINIVVERCCDSLENVSASEIVLDARIQFYDKISTTEIDKALILCARSKIEKDPNYGYVAARLLINTLYKEVFGENADSHAFELQYKSSFIKNIKKLVKVGVLNKECLSYDLKRLADSLNVSRDLLFKYHGIQNLYDRYFIRYNDKVMETPQAYFMRISMGLCFNEGKNKEDKVIELYDIYSQFLASPSSPTLFNSAKIKNQLSSCYVSEICDSIDGIFDGLWQEARKSKYAGGLAFHVSSIRGTNSYIKGTNGKSSGLIPWLKIYNDMLIACDQAGLRKGSGCAYLENWHIDTEEFIDLRKETGEERRRTHDLNIALWVSDLFIKRVKNDQDWTLFCPSEAKGLTEVYGENFEKLYIEYEQKAKDGKIKLFKIIKAKSLWKEMLKSYYATSHPWICWKDTCNARYQNIHEGILHGNNLCAEITIHSKSSTYEDGKKISVGKTGVCTLSSINLVTHIVDNKIDYKKLENTICKVIRALDNAVTLNFYPTEEASNSALGSRDIGMGTMGWADLYYKLNILQDSEEGVKLADELTEYISYCAISASNQLARERGFYKNYEGSNWSKGILPIDTYFRNMLERELSNNIIGDKGKLDWNSLREGIREYGMRNAQVMAIAPNASIAYQLGVEQSIEPNYSMLFTYENKSGKYYIINEFFVNDMKKERLWTSSFIESLKMSDGDVLLLNIPEKYKRKYKTAFDRDQLMLLKAVAARQKWICQSISFNCWNNGTSLKFLSDYYIAGHEYGIKTHYYLRNVPASKAQKSTVKNNNGTELPVTTSSVNRIFIDNNKKEDRITTCSLEAKKNGQECIMCEG